MQVTDLQLQNKTLCFCLYDVKKNDAHTSPKEQFSLNEQEELAIRPH
jgi:hypothetical protein